MTSVPSQLCLSPWVEDGYPQVSSESQIPSPALPCLVPCVLSPPRVVGTVTPRRKLGPGSSVHTQGHPKLEQSILQDMAPQVLLCSAHSCPREEVAHPGKYKSLKEEGGTLQNYLM